MNNYKIRISGRKNLSGSIEVSGAKNASLPELAATILSDSGVRLTGVPNVEDVKTMFNALESIGASGNFEKNEVNINFSKIREPLVSETISKTSRSSILILGLVQGGDSPQSYTVISPRLSFTYDIGGDGKNVVKLSVWIKEVFLFLT